jgi:FdhD protein
MRTVQKTFARTGGLHAAAIFDLKGNLLALREDVGRHNAVDKVLGWGFLENRLPFDSHILLVSGRASFEILQKSLAANISVVAAISAPSSLAIEFARESGQMLVGFLRGETMNVYAGRQRIS